MGKTKGFDINHAIADMKKDNKLMMAVAGFVAMVVGLFLPWYEANVFGARLSSSPGLNDTGLLIFIAAVIGGGAILNVLEKDAKQMMTVAKVAVVLAALIILSNYPESDFGSNVKVSIGYWLSVAGAVSAAVGVFSKK